MRRTGFGGERSGGERQSRQHQKKFELIVAPPTRSGDRVTAVVRATALIGTRPLTGWRVRLSVDGLDRGNFVVGNDGTITTTIVILPLDEAQSALVSAVFQDPQTRETHVEDRSLAIPPVERKASAKPMFLSVSPRRVGNSVTLLCRVLDHEHRGVKSNLTFVRNNRRRVVETDDQGEHMFALELTDAETEIGVYATGYGAEGYEYTFRRRDEVSETEEQQAETPTEPPASASETPRGAWLGTQVTGILRILALPFTLPFSARWNNAALAVLFFLMIGWVIATVAEVFFFPGTPAGVHAIHELSPSVPQPDGLDDFIASSPSATQTRFVKTTIHDRSWFFLKWVWLPPIIFVLFVPIAFWDEVRDAWRAAQDRLEQRHRIIRLRPEEQQEKNQPAQSGERRTAQNDSKPPEKKGWFHDQAGIFKRFIVVEMLGEFLPDILMRLARRTFGQNLLGRG